MIGNDGRYIGKSAPPRMLTIEAPGGARGRWLVYCVGTSIESDVLMLSKLINNGNTGFKVGIEICNQVVPDGIVKEHQDLIYYDVLDCVLNTEEHSDHGLTINKNVDIFSMMVHEASINDSYYDWVKKRVEEIYGDPSTDDGKDLRVRLLFENFQSAVEENIKRASVI